MRNLTEVREQRFARTLKLCQAAHPFYRKRFAELGVSTGDIGGLDDLEKLPLTSKTDYMAQPENFRLVADDMVADDMGDAAFEETTLWNVAYTTGTSGRPSPFFNTTHDQYAIMHQARVCAEVEGFVANDVLANLLPLPPMPTGGYLVVNRTAEAFGIPVVNGHTGARYAAVPSVHRSLDEAIDILARANPSVFWGIPSFVRRFLRRARERGVEFPRARMIVTSGEPVSDAMRAEYLEQLAAFGARDPQLRLRYSFTEMQGGLVQCCNDATLQNMTPDLYHLEVVDPATGRCVAPGQEGALALTHLHRRGTVLLRYLVGDVVALKLERCPDCGAFGDRLVQRPRRSDALVKVKGLLINPASASEALSADTAIREFQMVVRRADASDADSGDVLEIKIEADVGTHARLSAEIPDLVQKLVRVRPVVRFVADGTIYDPMKSLKARRMVDER